jgi:hypothetical protein
MRMVINSLNALLLMGNFVGCSKNGTITASKRKSVPINHGVFSYITRNNMRGFH